GYHAYKLSLKGEAAPIIDGLTGDQRFFLSYGQIWRMKMREQAELASLKSGVHSPPVFRVNGALRNVDAWYDAFDIGPDAPMYLPPEDRVSIW
ncbi:MAG: M13-type metalloendopeptidase, partial [Pseudomonadota bacterium]